MERERRRERAKLRNRDSDSDGKRRLKYCIYRRMSYRKLENYIDRLKKGQTDKERQADKQWKRYGQKDIE